MSAVDRRATFAALRACAAPLIASGALDDGDLQLALELGRLGGEARPEVLLAAALVAAAPRAGDAAVDLAKAGGSIAGGLPAPDAWLDAVRTSSLVAPAGSRVAPIVMHGALLCSRRAFEQQRRLAAALVERASVDDAPLAGAPVDRAHLEALLDRYFPAAPGAGPDPQRLAAASGATRAFTVVTGGPGTGKTHTIRATLAVLVELARARGASLRIALAAPTGKAAARITQAIADGLDALPVDPETRAVLAALEARTLHRLLGAPRRATGAIAAGETRLPHDVVVLDEASMADLGTFARLVDALRPDARLVVLGDPRQLASVEAGSVLADLVPGAPSDAARAPALARCVVALSRARRFGADEPVGRIAAAIAEGTSESFARALDVLDEARDAAGPSAALVAGARGGRLDETFLATLAEGYAAYLDVLREGPARGDDEIAHHARVLRAFDAYRVLCVHRAGPAGADAVARAIGARLLDRERARAAGGVDGLWPGKPVMVVRNSYDVGLFNGDVGVVVPREGGLVVAFPGEGEGAVRWFSPERLPAHELALATTVHKAQGSQFDHVALVLPDVVSAVLSREVVYTGVTRARRRVTIAGERAVLRAALDRPTVRASVLRDMLWGTAR